MGSTDEGLTSAWKKRPSWSRPEMERWVYSMGDASSRNASETSEAWASVGLSENDRMCACVSRGRTGREETGLGADMKLASGGLG